MFGEATRLDERAGKAVEWVRCIEASGVCAYVCVRMCVIEVELRVCNRQMLVVADKLCELAL
jgi:hypothetical protein